MGTPPELLYCVTTLPPHNFERAFSKAVSSPLTLTERHSRILTEACGTNSLIEACGTNSLTEACGTSSLTEACGTNSLTEACGTNSLIEASLVPTA
ncbi:hypothetical protein CEXT_746111 [Caerostris extrusa]|uniref:Uncharacterized protein n=1 Tax=Caerostris extrusa TaxID=172846 RepID=A0AAV4VVI3_CAEEX|nr:hypothetical protein CEXT_746111 [Caerostris extrusa]